MTYADRAKWDEAVAVNTDPYGAATIRYADRWASLMEDGISRGCALSEIWKKASFDADEEGITGFMYGCAVSLLSDVWAYGEELRRLHNLATQIGREGELANEHGGVLNPAVLNIQDEGQA